MLSLTITFTVHPKLTTNMLCSVHHQPSAAPFPGAAAAAPPPPLLRLSSVHPKPNPFTPCSISSRQTPESPPQPHQNPQIRRRHNSSSSFLLRHLQDAEHQIKLPANDAVLADEERAELLELSLVRNRAPQFPGSIHARKPHRSDPSLPPLAVILKPDEDDEMLIKAVEIRRKVTLEIFVDQMRRKGKFGITYATNLASELAGFLDLVMIEAAAMKKMPEFTETSFNFRARRFIEESKVVPLVRWFKHNSLSYYQIGRLICMSRGKLDSLRSLAEWLKSIHVKERSIGVVLTRVGETILWRRQEELDEVVGYLVSCGIRMEWMGYIVGRCPELLAFSMEEVITRVGFFMDMGMNENDFGTMVFDCPKVLGFFSLEEMKEKVDYLKEFGLSNEDVGRLLAFKPQLMVCSIEEKWKPLIMYFYYLGIDREGLKRMLIIKPMVFCVDLETTIVPKVRFLQDIGIKNDVIGRMLVKFPPLLTYSLYKKIRPVVVFLLTKAGVTEKNIAKVISLAPELLGCSIARKLDGHVKYFLSLGITLRQLGEMIADFPMLLRYNVDLLRPKYRYLRRIMVRPLQDLIEFPRFFSYSLEGRIAPRHKVMVENRVNFKLRYMLTWSDEEFMRRVQDAVQRHQRFEDGMISKFANETVDAEDETEDVLVDYETGEVVESGIGETEDVFNSDTDEGENDFRFSTAHGSGSEDVYSGSQGSESSLIGKARFSSMNDDDHNHTLSYS